MPTALAGVEVENAAPATSIKAAAIERKAFLNKT
jgi:hypothetical protein